MAIRKGEVSLDDALAEIDEIETELQAAVENSPLRLEPDYEAVNAFVVDSYRESWGWADSH
jgi:hypothetical protein